jgi:hypothetical protein
MLYDFISKMSLFFDEIRYLCCCKLLPIIQRLFAAMSKLICLIVFVQSQKVVNSELFLYIEVSNSSYRNVALSYQNRQATEPTESYQSQSL